MRNKFPFLPPSPRKAKIKLYPNPILFEKSVPVDSDYPVGRLIKSLRTVIKKTNNGVGIAAVQIGVPVRVFLGINHQAYINPSISKMKGKPEALQEGCLSIPGVYGYVNRPQTIEVSYFNEHWEMIKERLSGMSAVVFQHEMDHLNGKLFIDKIFTNLDFQNENLEKLKSFDEELLKEVEYPCEY